MNRGERPDLLKWALVLFMPAIALVGAIIDGSEKVRDSSGELVWSTVSNYSQKFSEAGVVVLAVWAIFRLLRRELATVVMTRIKPVYFAWPALLLIAQLARHEYSVALVTAASLLILLAAIAVPWNGSTVRLIVWSYIAVGGLAIAYAVLNPERSLLECRDDKCSVLGSLLTSFFPQENVLALFFLPGLIFILLSTKRTLRLVGAALMGALIYASGSRAMMAAAALGIFLVIAIEGRLSGPRSKRIGLALACLIAVASTVSSAYLFFASSDQVDLTGRGDIYALLRSYWVSNPFFGPGRGVLSIAYDSGQTWNYSIAHEHGQIPYLLINGGLFATAAFAVWVFLVVRRASSRWHDTWSRLSIMLLAAVSIDFLTEPALQFDVRSPMFWTLVAVMGSSAAAVSNSEKRAHERVVL